ncbi:MAG: mammalian cell entry protein [Gordonia polyisoprenivorans]|nr:mammalian cell entry protein [Gordonia polyisoprenivorans]
MSANPREVSRGRQRMRGVVTVVVVVVVGVLFVVNPFAGDGDMVRFSIVAPEVPDGVQDGVPVDIRGETVGSVCGIDLSDPEKTRVDVCVRRPAMGELTQDAGVSFVSRNLFGSDALQLRPNSGGSRLSGGSVLAMSQSPADYTITATVRSAGAFTLPVLTPQLDQMLKQVSSTTIRLAPFLTATTVALQTLQQGQALPGGGIQSLRPLTPTAADALDGIGKAASGGITAIEQITTAPFIADRSYTAGVTRMIPQIGSLFAGLGGLTTGTAPFAPGLDLVTAFTTPLTGPLSQVSAGELASLIDRFGGAFRTDPRTGKTTLSVSAELDVVPGVAAPLASLLGIGGPR